MVEWLLAAGVEKDVSNNLGVTPIYIASFNGHFRVVELLLASGANHNAKRYDGRIALDVAKIQKHASIVRLLPLPLQKL